MNEDEYEERQEQEFLDKNRYTITCFPCATRLMTSSQSEMSDFGHSHKTCTEDDPLVDREPPWRGRARARIESAVRLSRRHVSTKPDHAGYPNHYANDAIRDLFEEVIHE